MLRQSDCHILSSWWSTSREWSLQPESFCNCLLFSPGHFPFGLQVVFLHSLLLILFHPAWQVVCFRRWVSHEEVGISSLEVEQKVAERAVVVATVALGGTACRYIFCCKAVGRGGGGNIRWLDQVKLCKTCSVESFGAFIRFGLIDSLLKRKEF